MGLSWELGVRSGRTTEAQGQAIRASPAFSFASLDVRLPCAQVHGIQRQVLASQGPIQVRTCSADTSVQ